MAQFNADILLKLLTTDAEKQIKKLESKIDGVRKAAENISIGGKGVGRAVSNITNQLAPLDKALNRVGSRVRDVIKTFDGLGKATVGIAGLNALGGALSGLSGKFGGALGALRDFGSNLASITSPINAVTDAIQSMGVQGVATAGGIAAATAALMAFAPTVKRAAAGAKDFADSFNFEFPKGFEGVSLSAKTLRDALRASKEQQQSVNASTSEYRRLTVEVLGLQRELNQELRRQEDVLNRVNAQQLRIAENVKKNIRASRASRDASEFGAFSRSAGAQTAIDKSIRRRQKKVEQAMNGLQRKFGDAPLMLPSSEMLNASERGIQRISSYYGDLNTKIDAGVQAGKAFTSQLNTQASKAQGLPPIFNQVERSLSAVAQGTATGNRVQQSWNAALAQGTQWRRQDAITTEGINRITKQILDKDYARIQAQKQLNRLKSQEKGAADRRRAAGGRLSSAAIGGAFPLLFGQSGLAAAGGAIGGLLGGAGGGFAGSLVGSLIGDLINTRQEIEELGKEMGLGAEDAKLLGQAFRQAGADADKFQAAVQNIRGVGFADGDELNAIRLASALAEDYRGKVDKISQAYANIASSGKAGLSDVNKFTAQGIPILQQLQKNFGLSRSELLKFIKDGKLSAQQLSDALVQIANTSKDQSEKTYTGWDKAWKDIAETTGKALKAIQLILKPFTDDVGRVATKIAEYFAELYRFLVEGAIKAAKGIANALAGIIEGFGDFLRAADPAAQLFLGTDGLAKDADRLDAAAERLRSGAKKLDEALSPGERKKIAGLQLPGLQDTDKSGGGRRSRVGELEAELRLAQQLQGINERIRGAERADDAFLQIRLRGEAEVLRLNADIEKVKASGIPVREQELKVAKLLIDIDESRKNTAHELSELERQRLQAFQATKDGLELELASMTAITREERNRLEIEKERLALRDRTDLTQGQKDELIDLKKKLQDAQQPLAAYTTELQRSLSDTEGQIVQLAQSIESQLGSAMSNAITGLVTGTQTVEQAMASMFEGIGKAFIDMATQMIAKALILQALGALTGGGSSNMGGSGYYDPMTGLGTAGPNFGLADGGAVSPNALHLVGERGPELFVPGQAGTVLPNDVFEATRNALMSGGTQKAGSAFSENGEALAMATSYTRERQIERDRQTLMGSAGAMTIETQVINNVEYATVEQVERASVQSAKRARAQVFSDMRNKPSTRSSLGMK